MTEKIIKVQIIQRPPLLEDTRKQQQFYNLYNLSLRHFSYMYISLLKVGLSVGHEIRFVNNKKEEVSFIFAIMLQAGACQNVFNHLNKVVFPKLKK